MSALVETSSDIFVSSWSTGDKTSLCFEVWKVSDGYSEIAFWMTPKRMDVSMMPFGSSLLASIFEEVNWSKFSTFRKCWTNSSFWFVKEVIRVFLYRRLYTRFGLFWVWFTRALFIMTRSFFTRSSTLEASRNSEDKRSLECFFRRNSRHPTNLSEG